MEELRPDQPAKAFQNDHCVMISNGFSQGFDKTRGIDAMAQSAQSGITGVRSHTPAVILLWVVFL